MIRLPATIYPRINCSISGCKRGTKRIAPYEDGSAPLVICGKHWRMLPKSWRTAMAFCARKKRQAARWGREDLARICARRWWILWDQAVALLSNPDAPVEDGLPMLMAEELRKKGLI